MAKELLYGFVDASGKDTTLTDTVLTVNGCLSTRDKWDEFDHAWQKYLKGKDFQPDPKTNRFVFHATDFWADKCPLTPPGLSYRFKHLIYGYLVTLVKKHTVFRFGYGVFLNDYRQFEIDIPFVRSGLFNKPGTYLSKECFRWNQVWAEQQGYDPSIIYMFDRGDEFWGELNGQYRSLLKQTKPDNLTIAGLSDGNKAMHSPLQAADIVAWECRQYYLGLSPSHIEGVIPPPKPRWPAMQLNVEGASDLRIYSRKDLDDHLRERIGDILSAKAKRTLIGKNKPFPTIEDAARYLLATVEAERAEDARAKQAERKARYIKSEETS